MACIAAPSPLKKPHGGKTGPLRSVHLSRVGEVPGNACEVSIADSSQRNLAPKGSLLAPNVTSVVHGYAIDATLPYALPAGFDRSPALAFRDNSRSSVFWFSYSETEFTDLVSVAPVRATVVLLFSTASGFWCGIYRKAHHKDDRSHIRFGTKSHISDF